MNKNRKQHWTISGFLWGNFLLPESLLTAQQREGLEGPGCSPPSRQEWSAAPPCLQPASNPVCLPGCQTAPSQQQGAPFLVDPVLKLPRINVIFLMERGEDLKDPRATLHFLTSPVTWTVLSRCLDSPGLGPRPSADTES